MLVTRSRSRQPIDMTPPGPRGPARAGSDPTPRRALTVATELRSRIAEGRLQEGDRLPSLAELGAEFDISRPTLREAIRILEMEFLLDLRGGDRSGATIRTPSTQVAAQLAGIVLEARRTTLADFYRALQLIEPAMIEVVAARIGKRTLKQLEELDAELGASVEDTGRFVRVWDTMSALCFAATQNPALRVTAEILQWVRVGVLPAIAADANTLPGVAKSNRKARALVSDLIAAMARGDTARARDTWAALQDINMQYLEASALSERLVVDLLG
jgi:DNA-binding FadR family transcriptional regulator